MQQHLLKETLQRYLAGKTTPDEEKALYDWYLSFNDDEVEFIVDEGESRDALEKRLFRKLNEKINPVRHRPAVHRVHFLRTAWFKYAAAVLLLIGSAIYFFNSGDDKPASLAVEHYAFDVAPGNNKAILVLADGSTIVLDSAGNGALARQGNTTITKLDGGSLAYNEGATGYSVEYNTMSTPKGGQYHVVLPDGSQVWLNAASSIRFPTSFAKERQVVITGEAYFEVVKKASMPFRVITGQQTEIDVLGTSFNVMSYSNEQTVNTTLIDGAVRINNGNKSAILSPGEQARSAKTISVIKNADVNKAIAWKNGIIDVEGVGLREMMRQLERWYDIEVVYEGNVPDITFFGKMSRRSKLSTVLEALKGFGLHYKIANERKIIVMP